MPPKSFRPYKDVVARLVDVAKIEEMAEAKAFKTLEGLLAETKWILHNTVVVHGSKCRDILSMCLQNAHSCSFQDSQKSLTLPRRLWTFVRLRSLPQNCAP